MTVVAAYADPPYLGQARKHYGPAAREVDHRLLVAHLEEFERWALSCSSPSVRTILPLCPEGVRLMAWVKPFASFKKGVNPAYAWEPVIVKAPMLPSGNEVATTRDWVSASITLKRGTSGAKPEAFCRWLFDVLGLTPTDELRDLFPGSGAIARSWQAFKEQVSFGPMWRLRRVGGYDPDKSRARGEAS